MTPPDIRVTSGIRYGTALVGTTDPRPRPLFLDRYEPSGEPAAGAQRRPALILAFGGAFHRGSRQDDTVHDAAGRNTAISEYCARFARRGFVACSIDYRLVPEDPVPGDTPVLSDPGAVPRSRVDVVRGILGLPPATTDQLARGIEAATDDMAAAFRFVATQAPAWHIDPARIAIGGFSAGARIALNAAYAEGIAPAAVVALSGYMDTADLVRHVRPGGPPALLVSSENDLDYIRAQAPAMLAHFRKAGIPTRGATVPGATHFYPAEAPVHCDDGTRGTVEQTMTRFLAEHLHHPTASH